MTFNRKVNPEWLSHIPGSPLIAEKILRSGFQVFFIKETGLVIPPFLESCEYPGKMGEVSKVWSNLHVVEESNHEEIEQAKKRLDFLGEIDREIANPFNQRIRHLRTDESGLVFFALLDKDSLFPVYSFFRKIHFQQIRKHFFPIHASGIIYQDALFVFGGPSGIGKSTISELSTHHGAIVLDEDQLLIKTGDGNYSANAWGYNLTETSVPIKAVFQLIQSNENRLNRLKKSQTSQFLIQQIIDAVGDELPEDIIRSIVSAASEMARKVPGYELHFQNSPDFWRLLQKEFRLD